jgi:acyl-coenzyme A synthetase/AMP-(fatty) acid ligase/thioesterase domain-containing protein
MTSRPSAMATGIVEWAARAPDRAAFVDVQRTLTLGELDAAAAALAARLLDGGPSSVAGTPSWLPVLVDRSCASTVALHGAVRAGCAFTPIESATARELVAELFARLGDPNRAIVTQRAYADLLPAGVEAIPAFGHEATGAAAPQPVDHEAAGLVMFTSGSTGHPKGVVLPWSWFDQRVDTALEIGPHPDVGTWREGIVLPFGFGPGIRGTILPCVGRTLCIADPTTTSVDDLLGWLDAQRIDSVSFPPSFASAILRIADGRRRLPSVSILRSDAEALEWELVAPLRRLVGPHVTIRANYSASEVGRIAGFEIGPDDPIAVGRVPLGRIEPAMHVRLEAVVDDPSLTQLVIARPRSFGYLGDPELTARRYVTDEQGVRWWRSGDLVRVDDAGVYHHLGRTDEMVKIHGRFVAPSRVEQVLRSIDGIGAAAVIPTSASIGKVRLVAHVRVDDDALTPEQVHAHLRKRLPWHMMPAIVVRHHELPRTERHKLDRRSLEGAALVRWRSAARRETFVDVERWCLAEVRRIVGLDDIGPDDDLFEAGLDSLAALELCAALADAGFEDVDPSLLLEARTVTGICASTARTVVLGPSTVVALNGSGTRTPLFVLPGGGGTALNFRFLAESLGADQPVLVIEQRGMHRPGPPDRTIAALADHALAETETWLGPADPCVILGYSASARVAYEAAQRMHAAGRPVHLVLLDAAPRRSSRQPPEVVKRESEENAPPHPVTVRTASPSELPAAVVRSARYRWEKVRLWRLERHPGPPNFDQNRYRAFRRILIKASRDYEPSPAAFPATLIHVGNDELVRLSAQVIADLSVHVVGGDHYTMLDPPEVTNLAAVIAGVIKGVLAGTSRPFRSVT